MRTRRDLRSNFDEDYKREKWGLPLKLVRIAAELFIQQKVDQDGDVYLQQLASFLGLCNLHHWLWMELFKLSFLFKELEEFLWSFF